MGPMLEQRPVTLGQRGKGARAIGRTAREEDHVVRPLDGVDAVDLHEAQPTDQRQQVSPPRLARREPGERVALEEQPAGVAVRDQRSRHGRDARMPRRPPPDAFLRIARGGGAL